MWCYLYLFLWRRELSRHPWHLQHLEQQPARRDGLGLGPIQAAFIPCFTFGCWLQQARWAARCPPSASLPMSSVILQFTCARSVQHLDWSAIRCWRTRTCVTVLPHNLTPQFKHSCWSQLVWEMVKMCQKLLTGYMLIDDAVCYLQSFITLSFHIQMFQ